MWLFLERNSSMHWLLIFSREFKPLFKMKGQFQYPSSLFMVTTTVTSIRTLAQEKCLLRASKAPMLLRLIHLLSTHAQSFKSLSLSLGRIWKVTKKLMMIYSGVQAALKLRIKYLASSAWTFRGFRNFLKSQAAFIFLSIGIQKKRPTMLMLGFWLYITHWTGLTKVSTAPLGRLFVN